MNPCKMHHTYIYTEYDDNDEEVMIRVRDIKVKPKQQIKCFKSQRSDFKVSVCLCLCGLCVTNVQLQKRDRESHLPTTASSSKCSSA